MKDDTISRQALLDAVDSVDWYHQNKNGEMVHGANSDEHQAWYKADDIYAAIDSAPSAQPGGDIRAMCGECDAWNRYKNYPQPGWIPCSERMPFVDEYGKSDQVLATCGLQGAETSSIRWLRILYFNGCNWCFPTGESYEQMVYAWMPLPKPYREGGQDGKN